MANKYLDITGVSTLWGAIKAKNSELQTSLETAIAGKGSELVYDDKTQAIVLKDANGNQLGSVDAKPFIKDGMLDDVVIYTATGNEVDYNGVPSTKGEQFIKFIWNTSAGTKTDFIKLSDISKTYSGSDSIGINANENNAIFVKEVKGNVVKTNAITLGGTPLGDYIKANGGPTSIPAGDLNELLKALLSADVYPEGYKRNPATLALSFNAPKCKLSSTTSPVEVGTTLTFTATCGTSSASGSYTFEGFTNGYKTATDGVTVSGNPGSVSLKDITTNNNVNTLSFTVTGFNNATISSVSGTHETVASTSVTLTVSETSTNKVTVTAVSPSYKAKTPSIAKYYAVSSLGNTSEDEIIDALAATTDYTHNVASATKTVTSDTIKGERKMFWGTSTTSCAASTSAEVRALGHSNFYSSSVTLTIPSGTKDVTVAMPKSWSITEIKDNGTNYVITDNLKKVLGENDVEVLVPVNGLNNFAAADYNIYKYVPSAAMDSTTWTVKLSK
jgi:hypothetical protein